MIIAIFFIDILCWAPWISQVQDTGLPSIILRAQPWLYAHVYTVHLLLWGTIIWKKKRTNEHTKKEKQKNKKATSTPTEKLDKSFSKKQKCNRTKLIISWTIPKDLQKDTFIYSR